MVSKSSEIMMAKTDYLMEVIQRLSLARSLDEITAIVRHAARELVDADGATFVLRDEGFCHYVDEDAITPLWKGKKFPINTCVSGWAMLNNDVAIIEDIYQDPRVPHSAYRPTFVKSMAMTPIRGENPIGAIGTYWANIHEANESEIKFLKILANSTSTALENVKIVSDLKKSNDALSESLRARDEFLAIAAHELRTPLSALKLQLQMTESELVVDEMLAHFKDDLAMAIRQTDKLSDLTEQLLDISRIQLEKLDLSLSDFTLDEAVRSVLDQLALSLKEANCDIHLDLSGLPTKGHWDRARVEQVIHNLVSNACKYARGKPIDISVRIQGHDAILIVRDHGAGVALASREKIFDRFVRAASMNHVSGLGLGLFIARSIVKVLCGEIDVSGEEGSGAIFTVRLPLDPFLVKEVGVAHV